MPAGSTQQFVRQTSGLVKEFGVFDTFVFNTIGYALGLVLASLPTFLGGVYPGADIYVVLTLGAVLTIFNGLVYGLFSAAMPRSGGDYVFISRTLSPLIGFVANWGFSWSQFLGLGVYTAWSIRDALSPALVTLGYATNSEALVQAGQTILQPMAMFLTGAIILLSVLLVSLAGTRFLKQFSNIFFFVALAGTAVMAAVLIGANHQGFVAAFNNAMAAHGGPANAYDAILARAHAAGLQSGPTSFAASLMALPVGYWAFIGFTYSAYVGGEVKQPQRSQTVGILGALVVGYCAYMITLGAYYNVVGRDFTNAVALVQTFPNNPMPTAGSMSFFAGLLSSNVWVVALISLSTFLWYYLLLFIMAAICVRNIFAWSFDRIVPEAFARVTPKQGAPWVATLAVIAIAGVFMAAQAFAGVTFMNYIAIFSVCFLAAGVAAMVFPYRRKELFEQAPPIVRTKILGVPLMVLAGAGNTVLFCLVLYSALTNAGVSGAAGVLPLYVLAGIYGGGIVVYLLAKAIQSRRGVNLDLLYKEIPPD